MSMYKFISVLRDGDVFLVRLKRSRLEEPEIQLLGDEIIGLSSNHGARKIALSLGPENPYCLYSVFLAKLVSIRNAIRKDGGELVLCEASSNTYGAFEACMLHKEFTFLPDFPAALTYFSRTA